MGYKNKLIGKTLNITEICDNTVHSERCGTFHVFSSLCSVLAGKGGGGRYQLTDLTAAAGLITHLIAKGDQLLNNNNNNHIQRCYSRFFTISSQRREQSPTSTIKWPRHNCVQITRNISSAYHVQHVV